MNEKGFHCIADTWSLNLGIEANLFSHVKIRPFVHIHMAYAFVMLQNRDFGILDNKTDQAFSPTGDNQINPFFLLQQRGYGAAVSYRNDLGGLPWQTGFQKGPGNERSQNLVRVMGFGAASKDHGISRFQAKGRRINSDIGSGLIDNADDSERNPHTGNLQAVGPAKVPDGCSHRVFQCSHLPKPAHHGLNCGVCYGQTVYHGSGKTRFFSLQNISGVFLLNVNGIFLNQISQLEQHGVFLKSRALGHFPRGYLCSLGHVANYGFNSHVFLRIPL